MQLSRWCLYLAPGLLVIYLVLQFGTRWLAKFQALAFVLQGALAVGAVLWMVLLFRSSSSLGVRTIAGLGLGFFALFFLVMAFSNYRIWSRQGRYDPAHYAPFGVTTADGLEIAGVARVSGHPQAVVISHGVADGKTSLEIIALADVLAERFDVYVFDYRGYGDSGGGSTFGVREIQDLQAVLDHVSGQGYEKIAVVGNSMGGMVSVMEVAAHRNADAVVSAGSPASFQLMIGVRASLLRKVINHWLVQAVYEMGSQTRLAPGFVPIEPYRSVGDLSPIPYLVIHGTKDPLVDVSSARLLYEAALEPKDLWLYEGGGHSITDLGQEYGDEFRHRLCDWLSQQCAHSGPAGGSSP